jgi:hypothetical protein
LMSDENKSWRERIGNPHISLPYTFFLLNDDMKLNRNWQFLI